MTSPRDTALWLRQRAETANKSDRRCLLMAAAMVEGQAGRISLLEYERASAERACKPPDAR